MNTPYKFNADLYYPWVLVGAFVSAIGFAGWQLSVLAELRALEGLQVFSLLRGPLAMGLTCMALFTLICRIIFACCYAPCLPVRDRALPFITVIIPAFNEGAQVLQTVRSIMASRCPKKKMQVICVDDGSQDDTWLWMIKAKQAFGSRVQLIRQPLNRGKRHALLSGFMQAEGEIYVTIDSDSEVLPDTLRHLVSPFVNDRRVGSVAGNVRVLNMADGAIPKMMDVSFTTAFDFIRCGQSVYGGVFCTPGALSAYRAAIIEPHLTEWANQTFMGTRANIGEDRALTNLVLGCGYRVVYQRKAVVLTKMPVTYGGLRRMLIRWARSNVRENLVMISFLVKRFRIGHNGGTWVRLFSATQIVRMTLGEAFKVALMVQMLLSPLVTLIPVVVGCFSTAILPAVVHQLRYGGWFGWRWAIPYSFFWTFGLSWISLWGLFTAPRSSWLTRGMPSLPKPVSPTTLIPPASPA
jgi:hyaluronan synthase